MARTVLGLGQRSDSFQYGSAESPTLRPCPGLRTVGAEFSGAPDPGRLAHVRGTSAEMDSAIFQFSETTGAPRGLSFAAVKNSAPRARRSPPRRNAGDRLVRKRDAMPLAQAWFGGAQRALSASNSLPIVKTQPPARPFIGFNRLKKHRRQFFNPLLSLSSPPGGSKPGWTAAPELSEAPTVRWSGQYSAWAKEVILFSTAVPLGQRCGPVRAYGRLAASFPR